MGKLQSRKKKNTLWLVLGLSLLVVLAVASAAGFFFFNQNNKFSEKIDLTIAAPENVASGEEVDLTITIKNNERTPLRDALITLTSPTTFFFTKSNPASQEDRGMTWELGAIAAGAQKKIVVTGRIIGNLDSTQDFSARMNYKPGNFNYDFTKVVSAKVPITSSTVELEVTGPNKSVKDQQVAYTITYRNTSPGALENLRIRVDYPKDFVAKKFDPKPTVDVTSNEWVVSSLAQGAEGKITIEGILGGKTGDNKDLEAQAGLLSSDNEFQLQAEQHQLTLIIEPKFSMQLQIDGDDKKDIVLWSNVLQGKISFKNGGDSVLKNIVLALPVSADIFDLAAVSIGERGILDKGEIRWSYKDMTDLAQIDPGENGEVSFSVSLKKAPSTGKNSQKQVSGLLQAKVAEGHLDDTENTSLNMSSNAIDFKVGTKLSVFAEARYYDAAGTAVGSGSFPPRVDHDTTLRVYWSVKNQSNDVQQFELSTTLPQGVLWQNASSVNAGEKLVFTPDTRKVVWTVNKVPAHTGADFPQLTAWFDVTVRPQTADVGKYLLLTDQTIWSGKDAFTAQDVRGSQDSLSTKLETDAMAAGKGQVADIP